MIILDTMTILKRFLRWLPAISIMIAIFGFSSIPSDEMPSFGLWDLAVKKGSHMLGYGVLALSYWYGLGYKKNSWRFAFLFAVLYAITDEFHQSFIPGRDPSWVDAFVVDNIGAGLTLLAGSEIRKRMR